ncbi:MAG: leucyl aminopeptidase family protein [Rickettsiales bacterium]|nr:leucyl aminopeptidase family protein [Rickettsiales bacterium]
MLNFISQRATRKTDIPVIPVTVKSYAKWLKTRSKREQNLLKTCTFKPEKGEYSLLTAEDGTLALVLIGIENKEDIWSWAALPSKLSDQHSYSIDESVEKISLHHAVLGWKLGSYKYDNYTKKPTEFPTLIIPAKADTALAQEMASSICLTRDLINAPTNDMGPSELAAEIKKISKECKAKYSEIIGDDLLKKNYPTIHAVGRACDDAPRLLELRWGNKKHPKLTLVGKGVCFDTGGLNIKGGKSMGMMKKDMGGAGFMLGLARLIMKMELQVNLRLLIPAVENSISANAYRPQDVLTTRKGITVEISNTDAEGRLILCDALAEADTETPDLLIDAATLTGAARVATGTDIPVFFSTDDKLTTQINKHAKSSGEMLWQLPLWDGYRYLLDSDIADIDHSASTGYAGAITAALFLKEFVTETKNWMHIDMMAWNTRNLPGRPRGGEAQGMRVLYSLLEARYGTA